MSQSIPPNELAAAKTSRLSVWRQDIIAGLTGAVASVPDGLASAALAGVNPVYGLYAGIAGLLGGSFLTSAQLMLIVTTSASALTAGQAIESYPAEQREPALFLLVVQVGVFLALFGFLKLGRLVRFVSHAVMTGFLIGVATVLILDQIAPFVGYEPSGPNEIVQFVNLLANAAQFNFPTIVIGSLAIAIAFFLGRTRLTNVAPVIALAVPSLLVWLVGWRSVALVADVSPIPYGIPSPALPAFELFSFELLLSAFALATIIAVQGAGVSQSVENPDGKPISPSRDMIAQGAANVLSGFFSGIPAGGSVGQTALNVSVGAHSRWAGVAGAIWMLLIVMLVPELVGQVPMAVLGALMIQAGISAINLPEARSIWHTGAAARWSILTTFVATLVLSVPVAVGIGVVLTIVLYLASSATDVTVRELIRLDDGRIAESEPPQELPSDAVTVLDVDGSLFFAGARTLLEALPTIGAAKRPVVILRLRGYTRIGSTLIDVLDEYADDLAEAGGRLYLAGVDKQVGEQLRNAGKLDLDRSVHLVDADQVLGASTETASVSAREWLSSSKHDGSRSRHEL